jgi:hypothetical protein
MMPMVLPDGPAGGGRAAAGAAAVNAGRDLDDPADAGLGDGLTTGRDMVDEADGADGAAAAPMAGRDPVAEAEAGDAGRDPVAEADAGDVVFGAALAGVAAAPAAAEGAALAPVVGTKVVPHCTQNFAPG